MLAIYWTTRVAVSVQLTGFSLRYGERGNAERLRLVKC